MPIINPVKSMAAGDIQAAAEESVVETKDGICNPLNPNAAPMKSERNIGEQIVFKDNFPLAPGVIQESPIV